MAVSSDSRVERLIQPRRRHAERFQFAVQRRALHADKGRGARDIAAEPVDLRQQIIALEDFARLAQRQRDDEIGFCPMSPRAIAAPLKFAGRRSAEIAPAASSDARISSRSTILRSWRTLPGQL